MDFDAQDWNTCFRVPGDPCPPDHPFETPGVKCVVCYDFGVMWQSHQRAWSRCGYCDDSPETPRRRCDEFGCKETAETYYVTLFGEYEWCTPHFRSWEPSFTGNDTEIIVFKPAKAGRVKAKPAKQKPPTKQEALVARRRLLVEKLERSKARQAKLASRDPSPQRRLIDW